MSSLNTRNVQLKFDLSGGRIISLRVYGEELLFSQGGLPHFLSGGDKTWIAPEKEWRGKKPPADLDSGRYSEEVSGDTVVMTSPVCRETGLQVIRSVRLNVDEEVYLKETIINRSDRMITRGVWNVSQVRRPFTVYFPGRPEVFRSYYHEDPTLPVPSVQVVEDDGMTGIPCVLTECYKFGGIPAQGFAVLIKPVQGGKIVWERYFTVHPDRKYAHASAVEVFNSHLYDYGEIEVHSPLYTLAPGERGSLEQRWRFLRT